LKPADQVPISRRNFIELCEELTLEDEKAFEAVFRQLGLSVDWTQTYRTISDDTIRTSQLAFLRNLERGEAYQALAPTLWDIDFRSAIAQAELEDREQQASYHRLAFHKSDGSGDIHIETTRPELLAACVALVANPATSGTSRTSARRFARRSSTWRCPSSRTRSPSRTRVRASPWCARSEMSPTSSGGVSSICPTGRSSARTDVSFPTPPRP
jgi:hypothetical protein